MENFKWYILKTKTNCEARAKSVIEKSLKNRQMESQVKEILIPERDVVQVVKGKKVTRTKKIYPGYVFVQMSLSDSLWHLLQGAANVSRFVGGAGGRPLEVPSEQVEAINKKIEESAESPAAQITFSEGEFVQVIDGPFKNFSGKVEEVNQEKGRVKVSVSIFGRPTPVAFDFDQVHRET